MLLLSDATESTSRHPATHQPNELLITWARSLCCQQHKKKASLCYQAAPISPFNCQNPQIKGQLTWTQSPEGVENSCTLALHRCAHLPTWESCQQLLLTLFNTKKCCHILDRPQAWLNPKVPGACPLPEHIRTGIIRQQRTIKPLNQSCTAFLANLKEGGKKPITLSKVTGVTH